MNTRISIGGIAGRMGGELMRMAPEMGFDIAGGSVRPDSPLIGTDIGQIHHRNTMGVAACADPIAALDTAQIWIDFTTPQANLDALAAFAKAKTKLKAMIIGATGFDSEQDAEIARYAQQWPIVKAGNFSIGANLLGMLVEQAARQSGPEWDIDILDTHHARKKDAPSGTAHMLADAAATGRGQTLNTQALPPYTGTASQRPSGGIGFAVRRAGTIIGEHEVIFASAGETLKLAHSAHDRGIFARGALKAAQWAHNDRAAGLYSLSDILQSLP